MEILLKYIREILIIVLILIIAGHFGFGCNEKIIEKPVITTVTETDTVYTEIVKEVPVYVPKYITKTETITVPAVVDTIAIIRDYFSEYEYKDILVLDSLGYGYLTDTVFMNRITSRKIRWDYKIPVITNTITTTIQLPVQRRFDFLVGAQIGGDKTGITWFGPAIGLKTRSNSVFTLGASILGSDEVGISFGAYYKLGR